MPDETLTLLKWEVRQRLTLLEALALWRGELSTNDLMDMFGIARSQASKDLALYRAMFPENLLYDRVAKRYQPTAQFRPGLLRGTPDELLRLTRAAIHNQAGAVLLQFPSIALVEAVERQVPFDVLRAVNTAIRRRHVLRIRYQSMSRPHPAEHRLAPHTLVHNGFRWHVRGYSYGHGEYRDFVLMRFVGPSEPLEDQMYRGSDEDVPWSTMVKLQLAPHPGLSPSQRAMVADDFGMQEGLLEVPTRGALVTYFVRVMGLVSLEAAADAAANPVVLANERDLAPYLWS